MVEKLIRIPLDDKQLVEGILAVPENNTGGLVIFVHGSGSSGYSPRNKYLSSVLNESGLATFLIDLLSPQESEVDNTTKEYRFNIELLTNRLLIVTDWMIHNDITKSFTFGYFGSSTGAAVAIKAAVKKSNRIVTIVTRSGRPDLVESSYLRSLKSSILLIVGSHDLPVIEFTQNAFKVLNNVTEKKIILIPGATHLFEEPGKIEQISRIASSWFKQNLSININQA